MSHVIRALTPNLGSQEDRGAYNTMTYTQLATTTVCLHDASHTMLEQCHEPRIHLDCGPL